MELTGKCKKSFEKWFVHWYSPDFYYLTPSTDSNSINLQRLTQDMRYGIYVDFFDSVGIHVTTWNRFFEIVMFNDSGLSSKIESPKYHKTRPQARIEAIKQANTLYNGLQNSN